MENARALDERLKKIITAVSNSTGAEIKRELIPELTAAFGEQQNRNIHSFLESFNQALKKI
ncbi:MAG: hypothetical protein FWC60_04505 [Firmicutes bacterium]|nr:hypothetical protein [Bacillota bacterium]